MIRSPSSLSSPATSLRSCHDDEGDRYASTMSVKQKSHTTKLGAVLYSQLDSIQNNELSDALIESLHLSCGDSMLLASLDLIDSNEGVSMPRILVIDRANLTFSLKDRDARRKSIVSGSIDCVATARSDR